MTSSTRIGELVNAPLRRIALRRGVTTSVVMLGSSLAASSCFDRADRWVEPETLPLPECTVGDQRCGALGIESCLVADGVARFKLTENCNSQGLVCAPGLLACKRCTPGANVCDGNSTATCDASGDSWTVNGACDAEKKEACRQGGCVNLCDEARSLRSNVGCEYWAVDLDNANVGLSLNAAAQQFAVVVSNPQPDVSVKVRIEQDDSAPGEAAQVIDVASATIPPLSLRVFKLGPREVDGSPPGEFDTGSHTALTRAAYRVTSDFPVVAYQFNPLENVNVFSNDASLLKPVEALGGASASLAPAYVAVGWPQTIASTDDPKTNFSATSPIDLRAFLTIVGTRPDTRIRVETQAGVIGGGPIPTTSVGGVIEATLQPFDVLNLETDDFNSDFSGTVLHADGPVVVFSGGEASDAPFFSDLAERRCCADHLEEQLDPIRTAGRNFAATVSENRTRAVQLAGASVGLVDQPEYFRVVAVTPAGARVTTSLPGDDAAFELSGRGSFVTLESSRDFTLHSDQAVMLAQVSSSQESSGIPRGLPGGDPSMLIVPPLEQFRFSYVFLTPDKYSFDFIRVLAPPDATILLDGANLAESTDCRVSAADGLTNAERGGPPALLVYRCQLSFPVIDPNKETDLLSPGLQNDGVHRVDSDRKVGVLVEGFDSFVSYAYAAGTELLSIVPE
ncbi:MAG: IgGFc-binding protein [Polyangiaceae bacterium]